MNPSPYRAPFTSAHGRAVMVKILLIIGAVATGMSLLAEALSFAFPPITEDQDLGENPMGAALVLIVFLVAVLELIVYVATVIFFLMWLYRAYSNLRAFNRSRRLDHSPGWAVGSFFIPFVNLVIPYRAVKEVWQKSETSDEEFLSEPGPPVWFPIWWMFWLLSSFANNISMRLTFNENVAPETATMVAVVAGFLSIVAAVFAYQVVDLIDKKQEVAGMRLGFGSSSAPPPPPDLSMSDVVAPMTTPNTSQQT